MALLSLKYYSLLMTVCGVRDALLTSLCKPSEPLPVCQHLGGVQSSYISTVSLGTGGVVGL